MNLLPNSCQQMGKKSENGKKRRKFLSLLRYQFLIDVNEMRVKNITVTVSVRVSATVRVSLVWFVISNNVGGIKCRCHVYTSHACQLGDRLAVIDRSVAADTPGQVGQRPIELQAEVCCAVTATVQNRRNCLIRKCVGDILDYRRLLPTWSSSRGQTV